MARNQFTKYFRLIKNVCVSKTRRERKFFVIAGGFYYTYRPVLTKTFYNSLSIRNNCGPVHQLRTVKMSWKLHINTSFMNKTLCFAMIVLLWIRRCHRLSVKFFVTCNRLWIAGGFRHIFGKGNWRLMNVSSRQRSRVGVLFGAAAFSWRHECVPDEELQKVVEDLHHVEHVKDPDKKFLHYMDSWETIIDHSHLKVWRKPIPNSYLYEYKVYGTFYDASAAAFFLVQYDIEYRKHWDRLVIDLNVIDSEPETGTEVVHWVTKYPYPMYSRDYVYIRRCKVDYEQNVAVLTARAIEHPLRPVNKQHVRVDTYKSQMVIRPHKGFNENGFDYILTYCDDPQAPFPKLAYNWMARTGVPDFVEKMHQAAVDYYSVRGVQRHHKPLIEGLSTPNTYQYQFTSQSQSV